MHELFVVTLSAIRKAAVPEPVSTTKSALDVDNIPSPKVDPILITADDTDGKMCYSLTCAAGHGFTKTIVR